MTDERKNCRMRVVDTSVLDFAPPRKFVNGTEISIPSPILPFYARLQRRYDTLVPHGSKNLHWASYWNSGDGYGYSSQLIVEALMDRGWKISPHWFDNENSIYRCNNPKIRSLINSEFIPFDIGVAFLLPPDIYILPSACKKILLCIMWETTQLPHGWKPLLDLADGIIVPTEFCVDVVRGTGTQVPLFKIPVGIPPNQFSYSPRTHWDTGADSTFNVLFVGAPYSRKGIDCAIKMFRDAFVQDEQVRMRIHMNAPNIVEEIKKAITEWACCDARIEFSWNTLTNEEIAKLYDEAHVLLHPSRGEGFGRTPTEAFLKGLPVVATNATGMTDFMLTNISYPIKVKEWVVPVHPFYVNGRWAEPDTEDGARLLKHVKNNYDEALQKGRRASEYAKQYLIDPVADKWEFVLNNINDLKSAEAEFMKRFGGTEKLEDKAQIDSVFSD